HSGQGTTIGPDLTGMAVHPKQPLLTDIFDPSRSVEANFRSYTVTTKKSLVLVGLLASETKTAIELFDAEGKKQTILRADIDELVASTKSLMPDGFEKQVSRKDLTDLLEFLTQRGKYLPLPLDKVATAVSTRGMFYSEEATGERLVFADYIRRVDVPGSQFAFSLRGGRQIRYLAIEPERTEKVTQIEFVKGSDSTAPVVMAVTIEGAEVRR